MAIGESGRERAEHGIHIPAWLVVNRVLFWGLSVAILAAVALLVWKVSSLYNGLATANANLESAKVQLVAVETAKLKVQSDLQKSQAEIGQLCKAATDVNVTLASPGAARARQALDTAFFNKARLVQSLACDLQDKH